MVPIEFLKKYPYFTPLNEEQLLCLVNTSKEISIKKGEFLFHRDDILEHFYIVLEGTFDIILESQYYSVESETTGHPGKIESEIVVLSKIGAGEILGWSG